MQGSGPDDAHFGPLLSLIFAGGVASLCALSLSQAHGPAGTESGMGQ